MVRSTFFCLIATTSLFGDCAKIFQKRPDLDRGAFICEGEFLYWRTLEGNLDFVVNRQPIPPAGTETSAIGRYESASYDWDPGFRVALGGRFPCRFWDLVADYTYFHNSGKDHIQSPSFFLSQTIAGTFAQTTDAPMRLAKSDLDLNLHLVNLYLAKRFLIQDTILLRFLSGPTGLFIDQDWLVEYFPYNVGDDAFIDKINNDWDFSGGGIRLGFDLEWYLGAGFGFLSRVTTAGFVGSYRYKRRYKETNFLTNQSETLSRADYDDTRAVAHVQINLGPNFGTKFCGAALKLFAGYEMQSFFNLAEINRSGFDTGGTTPRISHISRGLVTLQGLTLKLEMSY